ncbi:unnamed protein product [Tetraodon nigroviridis]|uniref:Chromosome 5 SCAF14581, whole genome shotgun sequence n=1 Tax=Tetraodon nigroviridis TaxID=99883 RepID=Q4SIC5_TETNG|nr:unnamed protein product [Tetraodon nigroviridis]
MITGMKTKRWQEALWRVCKCRRDETAATLWRGKRGNKAERTHH